MRLKDIHDRLLSDCQELRRLICGRPRPMTDYERVIRWRNGHRDEVNRRQRIYRKAKAEQRQKAMSQPLSRNPAEVSHEPAAQPANERRSAQGQGEGEAATKGAT